MMHFLNIIYYFITRIEINDFIFPLYLRMQLIMKGGYFGAVSKFQKSIQAMKQAFNKHSNIHSSKQSAGNGI